MTETDIVPQLRDCASGKVSAAIQHVGQEGIKAEGLYDRQNTPA